MSRLTQSLVGAAMLGQVVGLLGWFDPLFIPLVLVGPPITGAIAASRQVRCTWIALVWCSAGLNMVWTDWVVNHEDQLFHLALSVLMPLLAGIGWVAVRATRLRVTRAHS
jgi:hypothetical protein